jgi:hypothetical protein
LFVTTRGAEAYSFGVHRTDPLTLGVIALLLI